MVNKPLKMNISKVKRALLMAMGDWLRQQRTGVTFGDGSFTVRIYPYHLKSFDEGYMP